MIDSANAKKFWSSLLVLGNRKEESHYGSCGKRITLLYDRVKIRLLGH